MYRSALVSSLLTTAVLLAGCSAGPAGSAAPEAGSPSSTSAEPSTPIPSPPADPTGGGTAGGTENGSTGDEGTGDDSTGDDSTGDDSTGDDGTGAPEPSDPGTGGEGTGNGTEGLPGWPVESTPVHGGRYWAVYVAVGTPGDPALQQVLADVRQLWPGAGLAELACDEGAAEALGRDGAEHAVAVYFPTEQHVTEFRRRWETPFVGAAQVTTRCAD
ncbi:hypothetical protein ACI8AA_12580 [Geodermatophilus sp. SYSU D01180]